MTDAPSLFDVPAGANARTTDPVTSHAAGAAMTGTGIRTAQARVLLALSAMHDGGNAHEVMMRLAYDSLAPARNEIAKRMGELEEAGFVARAGDTRESVGGRQALVARITPAGRAVLPEAQRLVDAWRAGRRAS